MYKRQIKITPLTEQFKWDDFCQKHGDKVLPLMAIRKSAVVVATVNFPLTPQAGWSVVSLFMPTAEAASWA